MGVHDLSNVSKTRVLGDNYSNIDVATEVNILATGAMHWVMMARNP